VWCLFPLRGYAHGAVDYLVKPIVSHVLLCKVAVCVDIHRKTLQVRRQTELLRRLAEREHERQLAEAKAQLEAGRHGQEIRLAQQIQQKLFPAAPLPLPGLDIAGASFPAEAMGAITSTTSRCSTAGWRWSSGTCAATGSARPC
jgi:response regulator RpfG family c-di-GMP phosphodiesterase